jgi:hypothetical protein
MPSVIDKQGDQIGRILAQWEIVYFGQYKKNTEIWAALFQSIDYVLVLRKNWVGQHFGRFFRKLI